MLLSGGKKGKALKNWKKLKISECSLFYAENRKLRKRKKNEEKGRNEEKEEEMRWNEKMYRHLCRHTHGQTDKHIDTLAIIKINRATNKWKNEKEELMNN